MLRRTALVLCLAPLPVLAQTADRDFLTAFLEDNLSGAGRQVVITGFQGALSSQAQIAQITIADDEGVWLTLREVVLDWSRSALFSGKVTVNELSAAEIIVYRMPVSDDGAKPEATEFSLPDLPVSVAIGRLAAEKITLGAGVLGQPVEGRFEASLNLADGTGDADLVLERNDSGPEGRITLTAAYSNESKTLALDFSALEGAGGLVATAIDLPGAPAVEMTVKGAGPFNGFVADVALATDGVDRLAGRVVTQGAGDDTGFAADLKGDLAPLFLPAYAEFFGNSVALQASGTARADGQLDLSRLHLAAKAIDLSGSLSLAPNGQPQAFALNGVIAQADGAAVLLPLTTELPVRVQRADIEIGYDHLKGDGWTGRATVQGFDRADFSASSLGIRGSGRIAPGLFGATLQFDAEGLQPTDAALGRALGSVLSGDAVIFQRKGESLSIPKLTLRGQDYSATVTGGRVQGLADEFAMTGKISAELADLSRFDALAGLPLKGAAKTEITGRLQPLNGAFEVDLRADGQNMQTGQPQIDALLRGQALVTASVTRDADGLRVQSATLAGNKVDGNLQGTLSSTASDLTATLRFTDLSVISGFGGAITADARLIGPLDQAAITATATGQNLRIGNPEVDKLIGGQSRLAADLTLRDGKVQINAASLQNAELTANVTGLADGNQQTLDVKAQLRNLGVILPEFPGPLAVTGSVVNEAGGARVDLVGKGPGGISAVVKGQIANGRGDLVITGQAQAALANAFIRPRAVSGDLGFDLALNGPLQVSSLSGRVTLEGGRLSDPALAFGFDGISARADLSGGQAKITAMLPLTTQGKVALSGTMGLTEPYQTAFGIALEGITVRDPDLYEARMRGALKLTGPLLGRPLLAGQIDLIETELRVPSTGFGGAAGLPDLKHRNEPADVHATRVRAGLLETAAKAARQSNSDLALDITISAPNRLFLRGRGLDAELGGEVRLLGSLANLQPAGAFNLIRGRLDILGKRLDLSEALLQLEGDLVPFLRIVASTQNDGITSSVLIEGRADDPKVSFTSMPELPEEEVLAQLLFGQGLQNLSALQALQLANAVASLSGRGGEGLVSKLRQSFGLDNLDVKTTAEGGAELTAGKYIGKNTYTEITIDQDGKSQINLNLDLSDSITLRGKAGSDGNTGVGIFLEKDY